MTRRTTATVVAGLLILFTLAVRAAPAEPKPVAGGSEAAQIKALQKERVEVLSQLVKLTMAQYQQGTSTVDQYVSAQNELIAAELESTDESEKRIPLLTQQLEMVAQFLQTVDKMHAAGLRTQTDVYRAKSLHLDVKIKLLRERSRYRPPTTSSTQRNG